MEAGHVITATNGNQYYIIGKTHIKITEHFAQNGKPVDQLIVELIEHKIKENISKIA